MKKDWHHKPNVQDPPEFDDVVIYAFRALFEGKATDGQQQTVREWLRYACAFDDDPIHLGGEDGRRATDITLGKRWVFSQVLYLLTPHALDTAKMKAKLKEGKK